MADLRRGGADDGTPDGDDVVGADWLLEQLGGASEPHQDAGGAGGDAGSGESVDGRADNDASGAEDADAAHGVDRARDTATRTPRKTRWSWESGTIEPIPDENAASTQEPVDAIPAVAEEAGEPSGATLASVAPERSDAPNPPPEPPVSRVEQPTSHSVPPVSASSEDAPAGAAGAGGFSWGLTPTDELDPLVTGGEIAAPGPRPAEAAPEPERGAPTELLEQPASEEPPLTRRAAREAASRAAAMESFASATEPLNAAPTPTRPEDTRTAATPLIRDADANRTPAAGRSSGGGRRPMDRSTRILMFAALGLLVVLLLIVLFMVGTRLTAGAAQPVSAPSTSAVHTRTATPTPTPTAPPTPTGPAAAGVRAWDALGGGECLQPYTSPWAEHFTVVACTTPHAAQLVLRGTFSTVQAAAYPGTQALASQINLLCTKPGVINLNAAGSMNDVQVQGTYPATAAQWASGQRSYFCFVSRSSGKPITGTLAG